MVVFCRAGEDRIAARPNLVAKPIAVRSAAQRVGFESVGLGRALSALRCDVLVSPHESLPLRLPCPAVVVAQNVAYHCGLADTSFLGGTLRERAASRLQRAYYRRRMPEAYRRAAAVVAISQTAADVLASRAGLPPEKTRVALGGSDSVFLGEPGGQPRSGERLLVVSTLAPYKNLEVIVDTLALLRRNRPGLTLTVAGPDWRGYGAVVRERARSAGVGSAIELLGTQSPSELSRLYATSTMLLHLSECESFGLPLLEAMHAGLPVVAARRSALPEVAGDGAALVDPADPLAMAAQIAALLDDPGRLDALRTRGSARAAALPWRSTAAGLADAIRWAAGVRVD